MAGWGLPTKEEQNTARGSDAEDLASLTEAPTQVSPVEETARTAMRGAANLAYTTIDAMSFGAGRPIAGALSALTDTTNNPIESFREGWAEQSEFFKERREELPITAQIGAEIFGAMKGGPGKIDEIVDTYKKFAPTSRDNAKMTAAQLGSSYGQATLDLYMREDMDFDEAMQAGVIPALAGVGAQKVLGGGLIPKVRDAWRNTFGQPVEAFPAQVMTTSGGREADIMDLYELSKKGFDDDTMLFTMGADIPSEATAVERFHNGLADLVFPDDIDPRKINTDPEIRRQAELYEVTQQAIRDAAERADNYYVSRLDTQLGNWSEQYDEAVKTNPNYKEAAKTIASIKSTIPNPDGTMPLGVTPKSQDDLFEFLGEAENAVAKSFNRNNMGELRGPAQEVWRNFTDAFRVQRQETQGQDWGMLPVGKKTKKEDLYKEMKLAEIYDARDKLTPYLRVGTQVHSHTVTPEHTKAAATLLRALDDGIDKMTFGAASEARGTYALGKRIEEARAMGNEFFLSKSDKLDSGQFSRAQAQAYDMVMAGMTKGEQEAFKAGYKEAFLKEAEVMGPVSAVTRIIGAPGSTGMTAKTAGMEHIEKLVGKDALEQIREVHDNGEHLNNMYDELRELYVFKNKTGDKPKQVIGNAIKAYQQPAPTDSIARLAGRIAKLKKFVSPKDIDKINEMERLLRLSGDELSEAMKRSIDAYLPLPPTIAARATAGAVDAQAGIMDYLDSLQEEESE